MKIRIAGIALVVAAIAAGCASPYSEVPLATNFPISKQEKLQAAHHWDVIAKDVASRIVSDQKVQSPLYVGPGGKSAFDRAFTNQLISALVANGQTVLKQPAGALSVETDTQVVRFSPNRPQYKYAGLPTMLAAGVWALGSLSSGGVRATATVASLDAYSWFRSEFATGKTPETEIIVTTSLSDGNQYLSRNTSVYYVTDSDAALYADPPKPIRMTGGE